MEANASKTRRPSFSTCRLRWDGCCLRKKSFVDCTRHVRLLSCGRSLCNFNGISQWKKKPQNLPIHDRFHLLNDIPKAIQNLWISIGTFVFGRIFLSCGCMLALIWIVPAAVVKRLCTLTMCVLKYSYPRRDRDALCKIGFPRYGDPRIKNLHACCL